MPSGGSHGLSGPVQKRVQMGYPVSARKSRNIYPGDTSRIGSPEGLHRPHIPIIGLWALKRVWVCLYTLSIPVWEGISILWVLVLACRVDIPRVGVSGYSESGDMEISH